MKIDLRYMQQIKALAEHRNFARAAKALKISQPALSRSIRILEEQLGVKLFDRSVRQVTPTIYGKRVLELGKPILLSAEHLERELDLLKGVEIGELVIGTGPLPAEIFLGPVLGQICANHPRLKIQVLIERPQPLLRMLQIGEIDIMVADTRSIADQDSVEIVNLPKWEACYVCRPEHLLLKKKEIVLRDIFSFPIATPWLPKPVSAELAELAGLTTSDSQKFSKGLIECQYFKVLIEAIKAYDAIGLGLMPIYREAVKKGDLVYLPIRTPQITSQFGIISMKGYSLPPAVEVFQQYVIKAAHELI